MMRTTTALKAYIERQEIDQRMIQIKEQARSMMEEYRSLAQKKGEKQQVMDSYFIELQKQLPVKKYKKNPLAIE